MNIISSTKITFPGLSINENSIILQTMSMGDDSSKIIVITETTPFHPLDYNWPDQPADRGVLQVGANQYSVQDCLTAALNKLTGEFLLDQEIKHKKIRRDNPDWLFLVAHIIDNTAAPNIVGKEAQLIVDPDYRLKLSRAHTASHFTALALNQVTTVFWKKTAPKLDSLDSANLDSEAIVESKITITKSVDKYHCGKSLRKKGFDTTEFFNALESKQLENSINELLTKWCENTTELTITLTPQQTYLHEVREWSCIFPDGKKAVIPCGGTHIEKLFSNEKISVLLQRTGPDDFIMESKLV